MGNTMLSRLPGELLCEVALKYIVFDPYWKVQWAKEYIRTAPQNYSTIEPLCGAYLGKMWKRFSILISVNKTLYNELQSLCRSILTASYSFKPLTKVLYGDYHTYKTRCRAYYKLYQGKSLGWCYGRLVGDPTFIVHKISKLKHVDDTLNIVQFIVVDKEDARSDMETPLELVDVYKLPVVHHSGSSTIMNNAVCSRCHFGFIYYYEKCQFCSGVAPLGFAGLGQV